MSAYLSSLWTCLPCKPYSDNVPDARVRTDYCTVPGGKSGFQTKVHPEYSSIDNSSACYKVVFANEDDVSVTCHPLKLEDYDLNSALP